MSKSICIKSNDKNAIFYIINELEQLNIPNTYFSCHKFKNYTNVIIHYKGKALSLFLSSISKLLSYLVLDLYENLIIKKLIDFDYFYFAPDEQKSIFEICIDNLNYEDSFDRYHMIESSFFEYLSNYKSINLNGFIRFRLYNYVKYINTIIDMCVNKFIIDKEYLEFVNLLKTYVASSENVSDKIHLIYKNRESILLDKSKNIIPVNNNVFNVHYLSDITFSSNDYALNILLTLLPRDLYIHLIDEEDEFINTLKLIFDKRVHLCNDCDICRLYKKQSSNLSNTKL
ncbi:MAG: putative sporulation protein YtxC [Clostridia bacterium]